MTRDFLSGLATAVCVFLIALAFATSTRFVVADDEGGGVGIHCKFNGLVCVEQGLGCPTTLPNCGWLNGMCQCQ